MDLYKAPPAPIKVQAEDYMTTGKAMSEGVKKLGEGVAAGLQGISKIYSERAFREYQADAINKIREQYKNDGFQEITPAAYMKPDQFMSGLTRVQRLLTAYDAVKAASPETKLAPKGQIVSAALYGNDNDVKQIEESMTKHLDETLKNQIKMSTDAVYEDALQQRAQAITPEQTEEEAAIAAAQGEGRIGVDKQLKLTEGVIAAKKNKEDREMKESIAAAKRIAERESLSLKIGVMRDRNALDKWATDVKLMIQSLAAAQSGTQRKDKAEEEANRMEVKATEALSNSKIRDSEERKALSAAYTELAKQIRNNANDLSPLVQNSYEITNLIQERTKSKYGLIKPTPKPDQKTKTFDPTGLLD